jgi:hypothetical protein
MRRAAALTLLLLIGAAPASRPQAKIIGIEARLFDPQKGDFGANVLGEDGRYVGWNTFLRDGNAGFGRGDAMILVTVAVIDRDRCCYIKGPLTITAKRKGKLIARRSLTDIATDDGAEVSRPLYLQDIGCSGEIVVRAELEGQTQSARLVMMCGE